jgi:prephenate dehydrogenase
MQATVVGAAGAVGRALVQKLAATMTVHGLDLVAPPDGLPMRSFQIVDVASGILPTEELSEADLVVVCLPETIAVDAAPRLLATMKPGALWVDTCSVKSPIAAVLTSARGDVETLGINPLFAPDLAFAGQCVLCVPIRGGARTAAFIELVTSWGAHVDTMSVEEHDRHTAAIQAAAHAALLVFALASRELGYVVSRHPRATTPPQRTLLSLVARMSTLSPEVYWDVQHGNPTATAARAALGAAVARLDEVVKSGSVDAFAILLTDAQGVLGTDRDAFAEACVRLFAQVRDVPRAR